jgi:hypothetical protein
MRDGAPAVGWHLLEGSLPPQVRSLVCHVPLLERLRIAQAII